MKRSANIFQRVEKKYLLTREQQDALMARIGGYLAPDPFPHATICSLYLDTPDHRLPEAGGPAAYGGVVGVFGAVAVGVAHGHVLRPQRAIQLLHAPKAAPGQRDGLHSPVLLRLIFTIIPHILLGDNRGGGEAEKS